MIAQIAKQIAMQKAANAFSGGGGTVTTSTGLPPFAKNIITIGAVVAIGVTGYLVYKHYKEKKKLAGEYDEVDNLKDEVKTLTQQGLKPTLSASSLQSIANNIHAAVDGYGKNFSQTYAELLRLNNSIDWLNLKKVYGIKEISSGFLNPVPNSKLTLLQTLNLFPRNEVSLFNQALAKKGITDRI